ncbi:hypothetical protein [Haladaptatus pallidirubidus]
MKSIFEAGENVTSFQLRPPMKTSQEMLDSTTKIVADHPVTILPLLVTIWVTYRLLRRNRTKVISAVTGITVVMIVPAFLVSFLAEFTGAQIFFELSEFVIRLESSLADHLFRILDAVIAAELRVALLILDGSQNALQELVSPIAPMLETVGVLLTMFGFEFFAGVILIYTLYISSRGSKIDFWLKGIGVVLAVSGLFVTLIQLETLQTSKPLLTSAFIAGMLGFTLGTSSVILLVRPNFGGKSVFSELHESKLRNGEGEEDARGKWAMKTVSQLTQLVSRRKE